MQDYYAVLRVGADASPQEIEAAYEARMRELAQLQASEDRQALEEKAQTIREAYAVLSDPERRHAYQAQFSQRQLLASVEGDSPNLLRYIRDQAHVYNERALEFVEQKRLEEAITEWRRAIEVTPDVPELHYNLGNAYARQGALREAIEAWEQAVRLNPDLAEAHNNLGYAYYKLGNFEEARRCWEQALRVNPNCRQARRNLGILEQRLQATSREPRPDEELLEEEPASHPHAKNERGWWQRIRHRWQRRRQR